jgi:hypothetical protein
MKKLFVNLFFLSLATLGFTQTPFTEKTLNDIHQAYVTNSKTAFAELTAPDYMMIGNEGGVLDYATFKMLNESGGLTDWPISDVKIKQKGSMAIVTGITDHTAKYPNNRVVKYHQRFTETYEYQKGKWLLASAHYSDIAPKKADEEADKEKIKAVIEKETQSWLDRDAEARIACLANVPHALLLVYHGNMASNKGVAYVTNEKVNVPEAIKTQTAGMGKPDGTTFKNENYVITINGGTAFVTYDEISTNAEGKKQHFHEVRNLEKIEGFWKITYVGAVTYTPN